VVREKHRERNNGLPPNDPNRDHKPLAGADLPLCKYELECTCLYSLDYNTYGRRNWGCKLSTSPFNWGWDEEQLRKKVSVLTFTMPFNNVIINHVIFM
jgi:hypothetical protein